MSAYSHVLNTIASLEREIILAQQMQNSQIHTIIEWYKTQAGNKRDNIIAYDMDLYKRAIAMPDPVRFLKRYAQYFPPRNVPYANSVLTVPGSFLNDYVKVNGSEWYNDDFINIRSDYFQSALLIQPWADLTGKNYDILHKLENSVSVKEDVFTKEQYDVQIDTMGYKKFMQSSETWKDVYPFIFERVNYVVELIQKPGNEKNDNESTYKAAWDLYIRPYNSFYTLKVNDTV